MNNQNTHVQVLVVEDHPVFRRFLLSWLSRGFRVHAVADGFEALKYLQAGNECDVVVLDLEMPRIDGLQFLKNIRFSGLFQHLPVVALSSRPEEEALELTAEYDVFEVFQKPYQPEQLLAALRAAARSITPQSVRA